MELLLDGFKNDVHDKCEATRSGFTTAKGLGAIPEPITDDVAEGRLPNGVLTWQVCVFVHGYTM